MESIVQIRQMMADQKFLEVQRSIEVQLTINHEQRHELLLLYLEATQALDKSFPVNLTLELAELESARHNHEFVLNLISNIDSEKYFLKLTKLKLKAAESKGLMDRMYQHLSDFYIHQFEKLNPFVPSWIQVLVDQYFRNDFNLQLKQLAITLQFNDLEHAEKLLKLLLVSCVEKSSPKGTLEKLNAIAEVLLSAQHKMHLEIYQNFCLISVHGIRDRSDYKRIVEMILYFDDFKFQVLILNLMHNLRLQEEAKQYALTIRENKDYDFVYFDKYFSHLKSYFLESTKQSGETKDEVFQSPDLELTEKPRNDLYLYDAPTEDPAEESRFFHLLKYQSYTSGELCDLAVSFLQAEMPKVALKASELAIDQSSSNKEYLKGAYLKLTSLLLINDNRAALDTCLEALKRSDSPDDVLSFLYGQAEALIRLGKRKEAKKTLAKVLSIDSKYRMAKERLEKL